MARRRLPGKSRRWLKERQFFIFAVLISLAVFYSLLGFYSSQLGQRLNHEQLTTFFRIRGPVSPPEDIVIVRVDEKSHQALSSGPQKPVSRKHFSEVVKNLHASSVGFVLLDYIMRYYPELEEETLPLIDSLSLGPAALGLVQESEYIEDSSGVTKQISTISGSEDRLKNAVSHNVSLMFEIDRDRKLRRFTFDRESKRRATTLNPVVEAYLKSEGIKQPRPYDFINFYGPSMTIPSVSFLDIYEAPMKKLEGKFVLIGSSQQMGIASRGEDEVETPVGYMFGVEAHANIVANLLDQNWIRFNIKYIAFYLGIFSIVSTYLAVKMKPMQGSLVIITMVALSCVISYQAFLRNIMLPCFVLLFVLAPLLLISLFGFHYIRQYRMVKEIESALGIELRPIK